MGMTRNSMQSLAKGNGIPRGDIYEAALRRKWLKPMKLGSLQAELSKVLRQGMVTDCSQMTFRITAPKPKWLGSSFSEEK